MTSLQPYSDYVDSGVDWLGAIPVSWSVRSLRYLATIETGSKDTVDADPEGRYPFVVRSPVPLQIDSYSFDTEAILTAGDGDVGEIFHHMVGKFDAHQRVYVLHNFRNVVPRFLYYYFSSQFINVVAYGGIQTTVSSLRRPMFTSFPVALPDETTQLSIAEYLDRETAEIDAFIADQEELIALLTERRAAAITEIFDRVVVRDEETGRGARLTSALHESDVRVGSQEMNLLSVSIHHGVVPWDELHDKPPKADDFAHYKLVNRGDVVLNRMRAFQGAAGAADQSGMVSPDYAVFNVAPTSDPRFIAELLRCEPMIDAIKRRLRGIGDEDSGAVRTPRVNVWDLLRIRVELPSRTEQAELMDIHATSMTELDAAIADAREAIELSRERRAALISAAVTGKIDVRDHTDKHGIQHEAQEGAA